MRRIIIALVGGAVVAAVWCLFPATRFGRQVEWRFYDWHMRLSPARPWYTEAAPIRVIAIDEQSIETLGKWAWPRAYHAVLLEALSQPDYRPKAIGYDVAFLQPDKTNPQSDALLVSAVRAHGGVSLAYHFEVIDPRGEPATRPTANPPFGLTPMRLSPVRAGRLHRAGDPRLPWPALAKAGGLGFINAPRDDDGAVRRVPLVLDYGGAAVPSLALATVAQAVRCPLEDASVVPGQAVVLAAGDGRLIHIAIDRRGRALVNFPAKWDAIDSTSFVDVLRWYTDAPSDPEARAALAKFKDAVVFVGLAYTLVPDEVGTPLEEICPGVAVHAAMAHGMLSGRSLRDCPLWVDVAFVVLASLSAAALATWPRVRWGAPAFVVFVAGVWGLGLGASCLGHVPWTATPMLAAITSFIALMTFRQVFTDRRRRRLRRLFGQYLSTDAVKEIVDQADQVSLRGRRMEAVLLFCDLRGFTSLTERLGAEAVVQILNEYLEAMTEIIQKHGGAVNKFVGDEIFATFGVPVAHEDDGRRAALAGIEMQQRLAAMRRTWREEGRPELHMGVGISRGVVITGTIGSERRKDYTAIGDAVNLGSRLQELTKGVNRPILVTQAIYDEAQGQVAGEPMGELAIRGRTGRTPVYSISKK